MARGAGAKYKWDVVGGGGKRGERKESVEVEYDKTSIPLMETNPPLRATPYDAPADNL